MKKALPILVLFLAQPSWATWAKVQSHCVSTCTTAQCAVSGLSAIGAGNWIGVSYISDSAAPTITGIVSNSTFTHCSNCANTGGGVHGVDASYALSSAAGNTTITIDLSGSASGNGCVYEYSSSLGTIAKDTGATPSCNSTLTSVAPVSCALTLAGSTDLIFTGIGWGGSLSGVGSGYSDGQFPNSNGAGVAINTASGTGNAWTPTTTQSGGDFSIAFTESGGAVATPSVNMRAKRERMEN